MKKINKSRKKLALLDRGKGLMEEFGSYWNQGQMMKGQNERNCKKERALSSLRWAICVEIVLRLFLLRTGKWMKKGLL